MHFNKRSKALATAVALLALGACGGDDNNPGDNIPPPGMNPTPPSNTIAVIGNNLVSFDRAAPGTLVTNVPITGLTAGETVVGGDFRPVNGTYVVLTSGSAIYTVNTTSGVASNRLPLTAGGMPLMLDTTAGAVFGVDFNPSSDRLRITSSGNGQNLRVNPMDGTTTVDTPLTVNATPVGASEVGYANNFGDTCRTTLFYIDTVNDRLLTTTNPNGGVLTVVGPLGVDATGASGFEIISTAGAMGAITNTAIVNLTVGSTTSLYSLNLMTGAATGAQAINNGMAGAVGLSVLPAATGPNSLGDIVAVDTSNNLVSFLAAAPGRLCTKTPVSGLAANENLLDLDVRPANGLLYGLGSQSNIYTIVPATSGMSVATKVSTLTPVLLDTTANVTFGIDFNPVPDRLRIVSSAGQNLRVNVDTGVVANGPSMMPGDGTISGGANTSVTAVAYTNAIDGATQTTLYDIDTGNDRLTIQNPPNNGTLVAVGGLGLATDVASAAGFDINGRTGQALAALNLAGSMTSGLYTVNLTSGAVTLVANVGGGAQLRGLALASALTQASKATVVAVTNTGNVVTFDPRTPGTFATNVAITGLSGQTIIGLDQRPSNKLIYAVTDAGQLFTLNQTTGVATPVGPLAADPTDMSNPFSMLNGNLFGVDVNPVPDRLRVVSDAVGMAPAVNNNLRINMDPVMGNVNTITDTNLSRAMGDANAANAIALTDVAYTNNIAGATATTLFGLDTGVSQSLVRFQANAAATPPITPNDGILQTVGLFTTATMPTPAGAVAPGTTFTGVGAFDTFGPDAATIAVLQPTGMMAQQSQLFIVNLTSGALTAQPVGANAIGPMGTVITAATVFLP